MGIKSSETALNKIHEETQRLLDEELSIEEFHKRHEKLMKYWEQETMRLQTCYETVRKTKAIPKHYHITRHLTDKYLLKKLLNKLETSEEI